MKDGERSVHTHIVSVGTSILTNFQREKNKISLPKDDLLKFVQDNPRIESAELNSLRESLERGEVGKVDLILTGTDFRPPSQEKLLEFVKDNPQRASAELNSLWEFLENKKVDKVYLILTDTDECALSGSVIKIYLKERGVIIEEKRIPGYYARSSKKLWDEKEAENEFIEGLIKLRNTLTDYIRRHKKEKIYLNATGGFKPEVMILTLVGSFYKLPVYYRHEHFKRIVYLPPVPLPYTNEELRRLLRELHKKEDKRLTKSALEDLRFDEGAVKEALAQGLVEEKSASGGERRELELTGTGKFYAEVLEDFYREVGRDK